MNVRVECNVSFMFCVFSSLIAVGSFVSGFADEAGFINCWLLSNGLCITVTVTCTDSADGTVLATTHTGLETVGVMKRGRRKIDGMG